MSEEKDINTTPINTDSKTARQNALRGLAAVKQHESTLETIYHWQRGSLIVTNATEEALRYTVNKLGYEWSEGRFGTAARQRR
jgi:hypothetical protein